MRKVVCLACPLAVLYIRRGKIVHLLLLSDVFSLHIFARRWKVMHMVVQLQRPHAS